MSDPLTKFEAAFTPARRKVIYRITSAVLLVLSVNQAVTAEEASAYLQAAGLALGIGVTELAATHVTKADER